MTIPLPLQRALAGAAAALALLAACSSTPEETEMPEGEWLHASGVLRNEIERNAERLPWTHGVDRIELVRWFASVGEPAYDLLLELAVDERAEVAGSALAALGATRDSRLVPFVRALHREPARLTPTVRLERARALMRLGDWSQAPALIDGLSSDELLVRAMCAQTLVDATGQDFGYKAKADPEARAAAADLWREWWKRREHEGLLMDLEGGRGADRGC